MPSKIRKQVDEKTNEKEVPVRRSGEVIAKKSKWIRSEDKFTQGKEQQWDRRVKRRFKIDERCHI